MSKIIAKIAMIAVMLSPITLPFVAQAATPPTYNASGSYVINFNLGSDFSHDMTLVQDALGGLTGNGGYPAGGPHTYTWILTSGQVSGNSIDFLANYTAPADAVSPLTVMHVDGVIAPNGTMSGTWSDNYASTTRSGTWATASGTAVTIGVLSPEDFGVVNYDTGLGFLKGYTSGFGLTGTTFASSTSVVVKLYAAGDVLLQTNTAILPKFNADITGMQFSSPFDVSGNFAYATDGYWINAREVQFGQSVPAVKVVATVTLANGNIVTATNSILAGDPTTIYPLIVVEPTTVAVHIFKYIDGVQATTASTSANGVDFPMFTSTYNASFTLGPAGWTTGDIAYEASTGPMATSSSYSAEEVLTTSLVGASCDGAHTYALLGYGVGDTLALAAQATSSLSIPSFTNLQSDKYIVVKNHKCEVVIPPTDTTGHIIVVKSTLPNDAQDFLFTNNFGNSNPVTFSLDDDGDSVFSNMRDSVVLAGTYTISEATVSGWSSVSATCSDGSPISAVSVSGGETVICVFISMKIPPAGSSISGMKFNDQNRNGKKDANEPGLSGWVIKLKVGNNIISTTTDSTGKYSFNNIIPGTYKVREVHQNGWKRISKNPKAIVITAGSVVTDVNFGNAQKYRNEREDNNQDDDRDEQSGDYYGNHERSNYENNQFKNYFSNRR